MVAKHTRQSAENITKGNSGDKQKLNIHPLKGTVLEGYKDVKHNKDILSGLDKEELEKQIQTATNNSKKRISDTIQNSDM